MHMNGHHGPVPPPDHTSILIGLALRVGRLEGAVFKGRNQPPQRDWLTLIVGLGILGSAAAGKVAWSDALPSLLGLVAR